VGYDAGKQVKGRKIHALVNSEGLPMRVVVHSAAIQDRDEAGLFLDKIRPRFPWLELIWADGGYNAWQVEAAVARVPRLRMAIIKRSDDRKGFVVLPRRWVVERTFSWFGRNWRLAKRTFRNSGRLRCPRLHPACSQAAYQGVGRARRNDGGPQRRRPDLHQGPGERRGCADSGRSRDCYRTAGVDPTATSAAPFRGVRYLIRQRTFGP
jgi:transposase